MRKRSSTVRTNRIRSIGRFCLAHCSFHVHPYSLRTTYCLCSAVQSYLCLCGRDFASIKVKSRVYNVFTGLAWSLKWFECTWMFYRKETALALSKRIIDDAYIIHQLLFPQLRAFFVGTVWSPCPSDARYPYHLNPEISRWLTKSVSKTPCSFVRPALT